MYTWSLRTVVAVTTASPARKKQKHEEKETEPTAANENQSIEATTSPIAATEIQPTEATEIQPTEVKELQHNRPIVTTGEMRTTASHQKTMLVIEPQKHQSANKDLATDAAIPIKLMPIKATKIRS
jgi:hypothetical protein